MDRLKEILVEDHQGVSQECVTPIWVCRAATSNRRLGTRAVNTLKSGFQMLFVNVTKEPAMLGLVLESSECP
ncbi:hypothetical protein K435DRAFT_777177 [Dendrothele bispora CBS 962.96]|uniref:Uncharacterized protein n=1 Tax=Dendrothele bispora (strain CBS 962.96) TaxID=1314807 RepID=A0A4S8M9B0_DENBC|nr:hypothetical protein K435DRAFT_785921 [Dendrothele bispora CBS 962.96]THU98987.1 hypothetical protein K435DRAFT_777177 [Dendrothele bispora CBS 962.96]